ncbi:hypothetical protein AAMO2058_000030100 [Amorphochlora amoebiformis]
MRTGTPTGRMWSKRKPRWGQRPRSSVLREALRQVLDPKSSLNTTTRPASQCPTPEHGVVRVERHDSKPFKDSKHFIVEALPLERWPEFQPPIAKPFEPDPEPFPDYYVVKRIDRLELAVDLQNGLRFPTRRKRQELTQIRRRPLPWQKWLKIHSLLHEVEFPRATDTENPNGPEWPPSTEYQKQFQLHRWEDTDNRHTALTLPPTRRDMSPDVLNTSPPRFIEIRNNAPVDVKHIIEGSSASPIPVTPDLKHTSHGKAKRSPPALVRASSAPSPVVEERIRGKGAANERDGEKHEAASAKVLKQKLKQGGEEVKSVPKSALKSDSKSVTTRRPNKHKNKLPTQARPPPETQIKRRKGIFWEMPDENTSNVKTNSSPPIRESDRKPKKSRRRLDMSTYCAYPWRKPQYIPLAGVRKVKSEYKDKFTLRALAPQTAKCKVNGCRHTL